ncbi:nucleotidyltransferase substrate binding protein [Radiobacillus kanasensis]|uniref:nucleotidyltransferase substrate binding protein n=1 Tax=Radiobacillus kanasensis TaxID=2844358 RepID=UPI001E312467|nr:nucleotidyltransferase substrate binding protein [Radiobacillus kanasensis]
MLIDRNKTSHIYEEAEARLIYEKITKTYNKLLLDLSEVMGEKIGNIVKTE